MSLPTNDPFGLFFLCVAGAVAVVRFVIWLLRPPTWRDLDKGSPPNPPGYPGINW